MRVVVSMKVCACAPLSVRVVFRRADGMVNVDVEAVVLVLG